MMAPMVSKEPFPGLSSDAAHNLIACPCCFQQTLENRLTSKSVRSADGRTTRMRCRDREVIDVIAFKFRTGTQWVHLPEKYGNWRGV